jgi:hypothetical protein
VSPGQEARDCLTGAADLGRSAFPRVAGITSPAGTGPSRSGRPSRMLCAVARELPVWCHMTPQSDQRLVATGLAAPQRWREKGTKVPTTWRISTRAVIRQRQQGLRDGHLLLDAASKSVMSHRIAAIRMGCLPSFPGRNPHIRLTKLAQLRTRWPDRPEANRLIERRVHIASSKGAPPGRHPTPLRSHMRTNVLSCST